MTETTDINIRESADRVIALLETNRSRAAMELLATVRDGEKPAVQEALDRYVAAGAADQLSALRRPGIITHEDAVLLNPALDRLQAARGAPRFPGDTDELGGLTDAQKYDVYASIIQIHGGTAARDALESQDRVILGLRQENSTLASMDDPRTPLDEATRRSGNGVYDDRIVVLWKDANGSGHAHEVLRANTEPTAQYDHHAGSNGRRPMEGGGIDRIVRAASPGYEHVRPRKIEGDDVNGDGVRDLGRLAEGTYEMYRTTHPWRGEASFALRPTAGAVAVGRGRVQRDTNADGYFNDVDINGRQPLNDSFKIHFGSQWNTDSAGCQTIHPESAEGFERAVRANSQQQRWQYVLVNTSPGLWRNVQTGVEVAPDAERQPPVLQNRQPPPAHGQPAHEGMRRDHVPRPPQRDAGPPDFPPGHADAALFDAIRGQLPPGTSMEQAAHVMAQAKQNGISEAHQFDRVAVVDGNAWVVGRTPGFLAKVDLSAPAPPLAETLRQCEQLDQQRTAQSMERQQAASADMGGRRMA